MSLPAARTVFVDVDTQIDFVYPSGAFYVPGAEFIMPRIDALNRFAASRSIPVISTMDAHSEDDPEFEIFPPHCVVGTTGQCKPASTMLAKRITVPNAACEFDIEGAEQILLEKQKLDCFTNVHLPRVLEKLAAERYVVYGVVTEICVKFAALGLLKTGKRVELVTDAVRSIDGAKSAEMLREFTAQGGVLTTAAQVTA